ncbi:MAG TPA: sulfurtransferase [Steroidobacteraceae bacterium]|nr:sulfurtransferase [Steroidobacteraceae bacterium]
MFTTLISAAELSRHIDDPNWLLIDTRFDLAKPEAGEQAYRAGHIRNAVYAHLDRDLSSPRTAQSGRHPLPAPQDFEATLRTWGLMPATQVIVYDADNGAFAARLWWLLRWVGHSAVAVLDGGLKAWREAGLPESQDVPKRAASQYVVHRDDSLWLRAEDVQEKLADSRWRLLDARAPERYAGTVEPIDPVAGHVPGAVNHPFSRNLDSNARFLSPGELARHYLTSQGGANDEHTIVMCGSGVTACHLLLAMEVAGKPGAKLYAGSWSEWIRDPTRPVATGAQ